MIRHRMSPDLRCAFRVDPFVPVVRCTRQEAAQQRTRLDGPVNGESRPGADFSIAARLAFPWFTQATSSMRAMTSRGMALAVLTGSAAIATGQQDMSAVGVFTELHRGQVPGETDVELVMGLVERNGESVSSRHYHPGGEFGFVIEGTATIIREGRPPLTLGAGSSFYQPPGEWHIVRTGAGETRTVVFRVVREGEPTIVELE
jgi:quercetin dioxygenase-like cupin family protein